MFPQPRKILINLPEGGEIFTISRPLRASTPQGDRTALAMSEAVPEGSWIEFSVVCLDEDVIPCIKECLDYGTLRGLGQWRNSGKGTFEYTMEEE